MWKIIPLTDEKTETQNTETCPSLSRNSIRIHTISACMHSLMLLLGCQWKMWWKCCVTSSLTWHDTGGIMVNHIANFIHSQEPIQHSKMAIKLVATTTIIILTISSRPRYEFFIKMHHYGTKHMFLVACLCIMLPVSITVFTFLPYYIRFKFCSRDVDS